MILGNEPCTQVGLLIQPNEIEITRIKKNEENIEKTNVLPFNVVTTEEGNMGNIEPRNAKKIIL